MWINHISNVEALGVLTIILMIAYGVFRLTPGTGPAKPRASFADDEITAYDRALPKYVLAGVLALAIGAVHAAVKSLPPFHAWLSDAGHGGHLVRDIANTHLIIVVGGTVTATGLVWYALPRIVGRPLRSEKLAGLSFWCTVIGAGGFYLSNVVFGLLTGAWYHDGIQYDQAKEMLGAARAVPIGVSASIMGIGYWTFVANVLLTAWAARAVRTERPHAHLTKYFVVGALGLFVGTVQGVIQVMPDNEAWLHATAPAGEYIDPIAHAHVNLITGSLVLAGGLALWWTRRRSEVRTPSRVEEAIFWTLVPGSVAFYLTFMTLGVVEGNLMLREGLTFVAVVERMGALHVVPLAVAGTVTLAGVWMLLGELIRRYRASADRTPIASPFVIAGCAALLLGTSQGALQLVPPFKYWVEMMGPVGDAVANAHAQLNMLGGVLLLLLGLALQEAPDLIGSRSPTPRARASLRYLVAGVLTYWSSAIATALADGGLLGDGGARHVLADLVGPTGMAVGAGLYGAGAVALAGLLWRETRAYRARGVVAFRVWFDRYDGRTPVWVRRVPRRYFLAAEGLMGVAGFPGLGWLLTGRARVGVPLALIGPGLAWAIAPLLMSPYGDGPLREHGLVSLLTYLGASTLLSILALNRSIAHRTRIVRQSEATAQVATR